MTDKQAIGILLATEIYISSQIHNSITEVLRLGYGERGKMAVMESIEASKSRLDEVRGRLNQKDLME